MLTFLTFAIAKSEILNQSKRDQNFAVNFRKHQKQKWNLTKYIKTERKQSIIQWYLVKSH